MSAHDGQDPGSADVNKTRSRHFLVGFPRHGRMTSRRDRPVIPSRAAQLVPLQRSAVSAASHMPGCGRLGWSTSPGSIDAALPQHSNAQPRQGCTSFLLCFQRSGLTPVPLAKRVVACRFREGWIPAPLAPPVAPRPTFSAPFWTRSKARQRRAFR
jgi:hypothetical protein